MAQDKRYREARRQTVDPYTGEIKPAPEDADKIVEIVPEDPGTRKGKDYLLEEETSMDDLAADEDSGAAAREAASFTDEEDIRAEFLERQRLAASGRKALEEELDEHHSNSPRLSAGDIDADWQSAAQAGEETVGGSVPTPDQDIVDNLGEAVGLTYNDDEPLQGEEKLRKRDRDRWELNPASAESEEPPDEPEDSVGANEN